MTEESEPEMLDRPPSEMYDFVRELIRQDYHGPQKRESRRHPMVMEVPTVSVDEQFQPLGAPFVALTRNISTHGASLVHTARIHAPCLRLKIECRDLNALVHAKVLRCRQLKQYFEIGCEFVSRIDCGECADHELLSKPAAMP